LRKSKKTFITFNYINLVERGLLGNMLKGYAGKQLRISLKDKSYKTEKINTQALKDYLGGVGYSAKILYEEIDKGIDPLSPDNKIIFATGPLTSYRSSFR
jgi:aldehyde:ferredoxin oxidoreductase